jgi:hypothetical protein
MRVVSKAAALLVPTSENALFAASNRVIEINKLFLTVTADVNKAVYAPVC